MWKKVCETTPKQSLLSVNLALETLITIITIIFVGAITWFLSGLTIKPIQDSYNNFKQFIVDGVSQLMRHPIAVLKKKIWPTPREPKYQVKLKSVKRDHLAHSQVTIIFEGKGLLEIAVACLFERFYRFERFYSHWSSGGWGLGLAVAEAIVKHHQG